MRRILTAVVIAIFIAAPTLAADKLKADDVIAKHLASIGTPEARAAAKTRVGGGSAEMQEISRGNSTIKGSAEVASDARRMKIAMKFGVPNYPGEQWIFDGNNALVAQTSPGSRSQIGGFLYSYPELLREGLLGGSMFTSWPLLDMSGRGAKIKYDGLKKIDGRELHQVTYTPKKSSQMEIRLYFEPETFHHVKSVYILQVNAGLGSDVGQHQDEVRYTLEENFADFKTTDGLTTPTTWNIKFERQPSSQGVLQWSIKLDKLAHNADL